jgi:type VI secretion system protein ImpJ
MTRHELAPINWQMGQPLLPNHLVAQEASLVANISLRNLIHGLPCHGISQLDWDRYALERGSLKVTTLRLITRGLSLLVDYPGNSVLLSSPLVFGEQIRPQAFYFVLQPNAALRAPAANDLLASTQNDQSLPRRLMSIILSSEPRLPDQFNQLLATHQLIDQGKLAEFEQHANLGWRHSDRFIPALVQIGTTPFLRKSLEKLEHMAEHYLRQLERQYGQRNVGQTRQYELRSGACAVKKALHRLSNIVGTERIDGEIHRHPYFLYETLQDLATDLSHASGGWPESERVYYHHNDLVGTFRALFRRLATVLKIPKQTGHSFELTLNDGVYSAELPSDIDSGDDYYFVIIGNRADALTKSELPVLSSRQRLQTVYDYALSGVVLTPHKQGALAHLYGSQSQTFKLGAGKEHAHIVLDRTVAFLAQKKFQYFRFFIYHRSLPNHAPAR